MSEFIEDRINMAHDMIDNGGYDAAVDLLKRLKTRIPDEKLLEDLKLWEEKHDEKLSSLIAAIEASNDDPLRKQVNTRIQYEKYADAYLKKYNTMKAKNQIL